MKPRIDFKLNQGLIPMRTSVDSKQNQGVDSKQIKGWFQTN